MIMWLGIPAVKIPWRAILRCVVYRLVVSTLERLLMSLVDNNVHKYAVGRLYMTLFDLLAVVL